MLDSEANVGIRKVDHVTYAVQRGAIEKWAWYHVEVEGGDLVEKIDDIDPENPHSSMKLWCISCGEFGIALVEGIDRAEKSQVTAFVERHGDHAVQHIAFDTPDLDAFLTRLKRFNCKLRGDVVVRQDSFGLVKQAFGKGYSGMEPAEMSFPEYVERRPKGGRSTATVSFSSNVGMRFYDQIENARETGDHEPLIDFSQMPADWAPTVR